MSFWQKDHMTDVQKRFFPMFFSCIKELLSLLVNLFLAGGLFDIFVLF